MAGGLHEVDGVKGLEAVQVVGGGDRAGEESRG